MLWFNVEAHECSARLPGLGCKSLDIMNRQKTVWTLQEDTERAEEALQEMMEDQNEDKVIEERRKRREALLANLKQAGDPAVSYIHCGSACSLVHDPDAGLPQCKP